MKSTLYHPMETISHLQGQVFVDDVVVNLNDIHFSKNVPLRSELEQPAGGSSVSTDRSSRSGSMVDDLEYHITFPSPDNQCSPKHIGHKISINTTPSYKKKVCNNNQNVATTTTAITTDGSCDSAAILRQSDHQEPVIVLLGWYGCQDKHLSKYSKIYEDLGCITIRFLPRADILIYQSESLRSIASKLFEVMDEFKLQQHRVILHIFSNGGCYVYRHVCQLLDTENESGTKRKAPREAESTLKIEGCIFDSCPAVTSPLHLFRAITAATTNGNIVYRWLRSLILMIAVLFAAVTEFLLGFVCSESNRISSQALWNTLAKDRARYPQLFLYSKADEICHHKSIKNFAEERRKCGVPVSEVCWEDSPHVKHFIMHRKEYVERVLTFVGMCLNLEVTNLPPPLSTPVTHVDIGDEAELECTNTYVGDRPNTP